MKKVVIVGGGIAGLTAGIYLQEAGFDTEIYEKNPIAGGQCTGWKREGYFIDNCIHWLTGTKEGSELNKLWHNIGALGDGVTLHEKEMFFSSELDGTRLTFWRDLERTRKEMLLLSPEDGIEINELINFTKIAEKMTVPVEKPFDLMNILEFIKLGKSMRAFGKFMKALDGIDIIEYANRFKHPLIKQALVDYMPPGYQAYAFLCSYATVTSGNGDIPKGGSLAMAMRISQKYQALGGVLHTNSPVKKVMIENKNSKGLLLSDGKVISADYVICACDTDYTYRELLDKKYMPKSLRKLYNARKLYPVTSGFQMAFAIDGNFEELKGTLIFPCEELSIAYSKIYRMSTNYFDYEEQFAPKGKTVLQTNFIQTESDFKYWSELYKNKDDYHKKKQELSIEVMKRLLMQYPFLEGKVHVIDTWTPVTYYHYCNSFCGSYMSFIVTKNAKSVIVPGKIKGIDNLLLASQWQMGPGGLPTAAAMGKFSAYRIKKYEKIK